jgi:hypothetical protein
MANTLANRLRTDYEKITRLVSESGGSLRLVRTTGTPPVSYVIEYHCPSLVKNADGNRIIRNQHQVEISLGMNYPLGEPVMRMLTPVFNPHVWENNAICAFGEKWNPTETLDTLVLRIGALLQLDPRVLKPTSPANTDANRWVQEHWSKLPLGTVSFKSGTELAKRIHWS